MGVESRSSGSVGRSGLHTPSYGVVAPERVAVTVEIDIEKLSEDIKTLSTEIRNIDDWTKADNLEVEVAMKKVGTWKKSFKTIKDSLFNIKKLSRAVV